MRIRRESQVRICRESQVGIRRESQYTKLSVEPSMDSIFDTIKAREDRAKAKGSNKKRLKATVEETNEEAFYFFLKKVSFFSNANDDATVNKFDNSIIVGIFLCQFFFKVLPFFRSIQNQAKKSTQQILTIQIISQTLRLSFLVEIRIRLPIS